MTAVDRSLPRAGRARSLRDDLLDDLRQAAPMPAAPPTRADVSVALAPVRVVSVRQPADRPDPAGPETPTIELRVTPLLWWGLRMKILDDRTGFVLGVGPLQIALGGVRR